MVIQATSAVVVVSSDWRLFPSKFQEICRALKVRNIRVIGKTPSLNNHRPKEITHFITSFHAKMKRQNKPFRIKRWIAIDDRNLTIEEGGEYITEQKFVQTDPSKGLIFERAMAVVNKLNKLRR
jgi:hypothetical protein|tara:strand:+ start:480 stop:851 length:372 start_codon:yes stop_codon:yes gene_type:complete